MYQIAKPGLESFHSVLGQRSKREIFAHSHWAIQQNPNRDEWESAEEKLGCGDSKHQKYQEMLFNTLKLEGD